MAGSPWASVQHVADIPKSTTKNSFYRIEIVEHKNGAQYVNIREWIKKDGGEITYGKGTAVPVADFGNFMAVCQDVYDMIQE